MVSNTELPRYRCHKIVQAAKIAGVSGPPGEPAKLALWLEVDGTEHVRDVDPSYMSRMPKREPGIEGQRHPGIGGYYVRYADGFESWSPAKAFEEGYTRLRGEFAQAEPTKERTLESIQVDVEEYGKLREASDVRSWYADQLHEDLKWLLKECLTDPER